MDVTFVPKKAPIFKRDERPITVAELYNDLADLISQGRGNEKLCLQIGQFEHDDLELIYLRSFHFDGIRKLFLVF